MKLIPFLVILALAQIAARTGRADTPGLGCVDKANTYCVVPATAVGWQLNLKNAEWKNGVLLAGLTLQHTFGSLPVGIGLYGGLGASADNSGSYQGCVGASITNWGLLCIGAQRAAFTGGGTSWQGMLTFAAQLAHGSAPVYTEPVRP